VITLRRKPDRRRAVIPSDLHGPVFAPAVGITQSPNTEPVVDAALLPRGSSDDHLQCV
jgi:hypothetical protein